MLRVERPEKRKYAKENKTTLFVFLAIRNALRLLPQPRETTTQHNTHTRTHSHEEQQFQSPSIHYAAASPIHFILESGLNRCLQPARTFHKSLTQIPEERFRMRHTPQIH